MKNRITLPLWSYRFQAGSQVKILTRKELETHLITRALKDNDFKLKLKSDPKNILTNEFSVELPDNINLSVIEERENEYTFVLPYNPYEELSEDELKDSMGISYEDVATWVIENQSTTLLDEDDNIKVVVNAWRSKAFKSELFENTKQLIERTINKVFPSTMTFHTKEETPDSLYITIPNLEDTFDLDERMIKDSIDFHLVVGSHSPNSGHATGNDPRGCNC